MKPSVRGLRTYWDIYWKIEETANAATCYVTVHLEEFEVDATRRALAAESVGCNMANRQTTYPSESQG